MSLNLAYDLGGGAKLIAGIDKQTTESLGLVASHKPNTTTDAAGDFAFTDLDTTDEDNADEVVTYSTSVTESDTTTLELKLAFTF